ncbi:MAG: S-formylglutathione hydrolase, partial [bacterium]|nr:S-formylglutathione hydrolase [bacterium]
QLKPDLLIQACLTAGVPLRLRMQEQYSHNYYFISSFIADHLRFHWHNLS